MDCKVNRVTGIPFGRWCSSITICQYQEIHKDFLLRVAEEYIVNYHTIICQQFSSKNIAYGFTENVWQKIYFTE